MGKLLNAIKGNRKEINSEFMMQDLAGLKNAIAPSIFKEHGTYLQLGSNFSRTLTVLSYPTKVMGNWLAELYRFNGNVSVSFHLNPDMSSKMINNISQSIEELDSRLHPTNGKPSPKRQRDLQNKIISAERILDNLMAGNSNSIYYVHLYIHITAGTLEDLEDLTEKVYNTLYTVNLKAAAPYDNMKFAFNSMLPTMQNELPEWTSQNMDLEATSSLMPFDESTMMDETGIIKGENLTDGANSFVIVNQHELNGHNEFVLGKTGSGKSFYMKKDMLRYFSQGTKIYVIDPEREYTDLVLANGGQVIPISSMSGYVINPLEILHSGIDVVEGYATNEKGKLKPVVSRSLLHQKLVRLKIFFKLIKKDLTPLEAALVEDMLIQVYADAEITWDTDFSKLKSDKYPTIGDLYEKIEKKGEDRLRDFQAILKSYVSGSNSLMFNGHTKIDLESDFISFDLKDMEDDPDSQAAAMYNVLSYLWDDITMDKTQWKRLYVDEAHIMADPQNPRAMRFLFNIYKRIRKYRGGAVSATQQIADFLSAVEGKRNYGKAVIGNSQTKLLLGMELGDIEDLVEHNVVKLSEKEKELLLTDKQGEGIFIVGKNRVEIKIDCNPYEMSIIDPAQYEEKYGSGQGIVKDDHEDDYKLEDYNFDNNIMNEGKGLDEDLDEDEDDYLYEREYASVRVDSDSDSGDGGDGE